MTIIEAIAYAERAHPGGASDADVLRWLAALDGRIKHELIDTREGAESVTLAVLDDTADAATELLVSAPYDELYEHYLDAKIYHARGEIERYNNAIAVLGEVYAAYAAHYNATHKPRRRAWRLA